MIGMEMELEADLGIDSIKRVEILSAVREQAPGLPDLDPNVLGQLRTVGQIVDHLKSHLPASAAPSPGAPAAKPAPAKPASKAASMDLMSIMLAVVAQKTGYPAEMIGMEMELEADLGIDSIKRVEILSAVREQAPGLPDLDPNVLGQLRTVGQIVDHLKSHLGQSAQTAVPTAAVTALSRSASAPPPAHRWALRATPRAASGLIGPGLLGAQRVVITDDGQIAQPLARALELRGVRAEVVSAVPEGADAVICLSGLKDESDGDLSIALEAFRAAKALAPRATAGAAHFVTVQDTGGDFGLSGSPRAWLAGLSGLSKTTAQEWSKDSHSRAIDLERGALSPMELAARLATELVAGGTELEVGLRANGTRIVLESVAQAVTGLSSTNKRAPIFAAGDVVLASGGARGVTAATLIELARASKCRLVLLGRTAVQQEPASVSGAETEADLKRALLTDAKARGVTVTPAEINREVASILAGREVRGTLEAVKRAGGEAVYVAADVTEGKKLGATLDEVRRAWGPIRGIVHGAGVIADKLVADKTEDQVQKVMSTKVHGLRALLTATAADPIAGIVMFSSVAGRTGNRGQCDYAMANEILNAVACAEAARRKAAGHQCIVRSLGWGPWEAGMVTPALKAHFEKLGVPLVSLAGGAQMMLDELSSLDDPEVQVVLGGEPKAEALLSEGAGKRLHVFDVRIDRLTHPFVASHVVKGAAVLPAVSALELFARAARALKPSLVVTAVRDLTVLKGIRLAGYEGAGDRFVVKAELVSNGSGATYGMTLLSPDGTRHYAAKVEMHGMRSERGQAPASLGALAAWKDAIYDGVVLFHGKDLHAVSAVEGENDRGIAGTLLASSELGWPTPEAVTDTALLDGAIQLAVLWAKHATGGAALPTSIGSLVLHGSAASLTSARCIATVKSHGKEKASFDLALLDAAGNVAIEMRALEVFVRPGSHAEVVRSDA
jgi:acyl carrier protein